LLALPAVPTRRSSDLGQILAQAQPALRVHARGPLEVDRPGNMSALGGKHPHTLVLGGGAGVPDDSVRVVQISHQGIHVYGGAGIDRKSTRLNSSHVKI